MRVLELVGSRVWIRCDQFRKISGVISNVLDPVSGDDLQASIAESLFDIMLSSGKAVQMLGAQICHFDPRPEPVVLQAECLTLAVPSGE
jgi:Ser/Thr protein kinase RdoA (MazF antagonist)